MLVAYSESPTIHQGRFRPARKKLELSLPAPTLRDIYQPKKMLPATADAPTIQSSHVNVKPIVILDFRTRFGGWQFCAATTITNGSNATAESESAVGS